MSKLYLCFALRAAPAPALPEWRPRCPTPPRSPLPPGCSPRGSGGGGRPSPAAAGSPRVAGGCNRGDAAGTGPGHPVGAAPHPRRCLRNPSTLGPPHHPSSPASLPALAPAPPLPPPDPVSGPVRGAGQPAGGCTLRGAPAASRGGTGPPRPPPTPRPRRGRAAAASQAVTKSNFKPGTINEDFLPSVAPRASWH